MEVSGYSLDGPGKCFLKDSCFPAFQLNGVLRVDCFSRNEEAEFRLGRKSGSSETGKSLKIFLLFSFFTLFLFCILVPF